MTESDNTDGLPAELAKRAERNIAQFDRGLITLDELENELLGAAHEYAGQEYERAHPDWAKEAIFDREAWETGFEAKRQAEAQGGATYALTFAETYETARGLVEWVFRSPQWRQALTPVVRRLAAAGAGGPEAIAAEAEAGWLAAWRGVLPAEARDAVRGATLGSGISMIDLLEADREGDTARVAEIVTASGHAGCVSAAVQLLRLRRAEGRLVAAAEVAALLDPSELAGLGEFGGLSHMAVELLADGADAAALTWSSAVIDPRLFHAPADDLASPRRWEPYREHQQDRLQRVHGPGWCVEWCNSGDARLLGALAAVDWIAGRYDRARERAAACDRGADAQGWSASGVELLAAWVLSRSRVAEDRATDLISIVERSDSSHVDLGLLGVQIHGELAEWSEMVGDQEMAAHHRTRVSWFLARPEMRLHFETFQFQPLLDRLPLVEQTLALPLTVDPNP